MLSSFRLHHFVTADEFVLFSSVFCQVRYSSNIHVVYLISSLDFYLTTCSFAFLYTSVVIHSNALLGGFILRST